MMLGGNKSGEGSEKIYTKQIYVYSGKVYAEIIYQDEKTDKDWKADLWYMTMTKDFGRTFASNPREKDYIAANKWADEQLELLAKHCTIKLKQADMIGQMRISEIKSKLSEKGNK